MNQKTTFTQYCGLAIIRSHEERQRNDTKKKKERKHASNSNIFFSPKQSQIEEQSAHIRKQDIKTIPKKRERSQK